MSSEDNLGNVWILNVWASWCVACRDEHPLLVQLAKSGIVPIYGLNYKDECSTALQWLKRYGDPYAISIVDIDGKVGIIMAFTVYQKLMSLIRKVSLGTNKLGRLQWIVLYFHGDR